MCVKKDFERPKDDFRSARQTRAVMATATLNVEIAAVMVPAFAHRMAGEDTFGTPRRQNEDAGGEKVTMWAFMLTWMNTSLFYFRWSGRKHWNCVESSPRKDSALVVACMHVFHSINVDSVNGHK
jgi:hypothetical protein